jgi:uncharacterized protein YjaG (DUF416 family)
MAIEEINLLKNLDFNKQLTFAYLTCERVYPNYVYFTQKFNFGNSDILREAINFIYEVIFDNTDIDIEKVNDLLASVFQNIPATNDYPTFDATIAMYSGGVIHESLNLLKNINNSQLLIDIATLSTDAVDCFIQERDDMDYDEPNFEEIILNDTLMQKEITIQKGIISYLSKINKVEQTDINTLIQLQGKKSSLDL